MNDDYLLRRRFLLLGGGGGDPTKEGKNNLTPPNNKKEVKMRTVYWDVDGVLRDIVGTLGIKLEWGQFPYDIVNQNLEVLINANTLPYVEVLKKMKNKMNCKVLTAQPFEHWKPYLIKFLERIGVGDVEVVFVNHGKEKLEVLQDGDILIDDYPFKKEDVKKGTVIQIDYEYNRNSGLPRVSSPEELEKVLQELEEK
jgi:5'(3')-deoxyribonucleotidase